MESKELSENQKKRVKKALRNLDEHTQVLQRGLESVKILHEHAVKRQFHKRAIAATKALDGLSVLIDELQVGKLMCLEMLGAKKVPIDNQDKPKLKLVVDNEKR